MKKEKKNNDLFNKNKFSFILSFIITVLFPLINIAFAYSVKLIIDSGITQNMYELKNAVMIATCVILFYTVMNYTTSWIKNKYICKVMERFKNKVFTSVINKSYTSFSKENSGSYILMLTSNMKKVEEQYLAEYFSIIKNLSLMIFSLIAMFIGNWKLATIIIIACIIPMFLTGVLGKSVTKIQAKAILQEQSYTAKIKDLLLGFLVIKSFHAEETVSQEYEVENKKLSEVYDSQNKLAAFTRTISELSGMLVFLVAFGGGMFMAIKGNTTLGNVTAIIQLVNFVVMPLNELGVSLNRYKEGKEALKAIQITYDRMDEESTLSKDKFVSSIEFKNVNFSYPGAKNGEIILNNFNLKLEKGKKYALVGLSGSGKSTILNLLLRFFKIEKDKGSLLLDGVNINHLTLDSIYKMITIVQQNVYVFDSTLKVNITLNEKFTDEEVWQAIELAGLSDLVRDNPLGIKALCGENGSLLSGGQKQRLSIARSLIRKTPILLMDEATSSLDKKTTFEVESSILSIKDLTSLIITHKLEESLLTRYDEILFIKNGKISERGNFNDLISSKGDFYNLFKVSSL